MPTTTTIDRNRHIVTLACDGSLTYQEIGDLFGMTRERVRQIIKKAGIDKTTRRAARAEAEVEALAFDGDLIREWVRHNPARTIEEASEALGLSAQRIRQALGSDAGRLFVRPFHQGLARRYSDADIIEVLSAAAALASGPLTKTAYDEYVAAHGGPSGIRVLQRFGSWKAACEAAGVTCGQARRSYTRRWTAGTMVDNLIAYFDSPGATGAFADYDQWSRGHADRPSGQTIRNHFGSWQAAKTAALNARGHLPAA
ncbi:sigma factor-like helix-turn-helix DNA-binding protein [Nocardioides ferulae]|uniref:sigma factor-like helix-turn-helix DNA-binding protein n=1 Tax=Nocardioides ferulae TaxID=2340821 RepID=UPI0013DDE4B6|nr:sigma factor-like helix-turn-helix DNA-binding protein [Nocardioides ferulae]